jgi:hypothetical protein
MGGALALTAPWALERLTEFTAAAITTIATLPPGSPSIP